MSKAAVNVRERFSLEFVSADAEIAAFKACLEANAGLPDLFLFDPEALPAPPVACVEAPQAAEPIDYVDPVEELRMLFGVVDQ